MSSKKINIPVLVAVLLVSIRGCAPDDLSRLGDFDTQVQYLLDEVYLKPEQILNITRMCDDIKRTLEQQWTGVQILPLGSLVTGLVLNTSDVDILIRVQDYNQSSEIYLMEQTVKLLKRQPDMYTGFITDTEEKGVPLVSFFHIPTQRSCDISFKGKTSVENSELITYYFKLDPRNYALAAIVKFWSRVRGRDYTPILRNYLINILIVFYLQQKDLAPPICFLRGQTSRSVNDDLTATFIKIPYNSSNADSLYELLGGFFEYYSKLNFRYYMLSPFFGQAIPRNVFEITNSIPEEFSKYVSYINKVDKMPIPLDGPLCFQDLFVLNDNVAANLDPQIVANFVYEIKLAARAYEELPSNHFLGAILAMDGPTKK